MPNTNLRFPILRRLTVTGHALFPGKDGKGIDHVFEPGVTVIAGINGIGKTTMLNLIYRLLVGPWDPRGSDDVQLTRTALTKDSSFNYFGKRDRTAAANARARGEFQLGERRISVSRKLNDLSITELAIDQTLIKPNPDIDLEREIRSAAGCGSQYDFHLLVRSLLFFLEDKSSVVWRPAAQIEVFRVLFLNSAEATQLADLARAIQKEDSQRRNMLAELNRYKKRYVREAAASTASGEITAKLQELDQRAEYMRGRLQALDETADKLERTRDSTRQKLDLLKLELEEANRELEHLHHHYFASLFPRLEDTAKNIFLNLLGEAGCLVCGSRTAGLSKRLQRLAETGECPVCQSQKEEQDTLLSAAEFGSEQIRITNQNVTQLKQSVTELSSAVVVENEQYLATARERARVSEQYDELLQEAEQLKHSLPKSAEEVQKVENYIKVTESEIVKIGRSITVKMSDYKEQLATLKREVDGIAQNLTSFFAEYAASFLAEKCSLIFKPQKQKLGEATELVEFPTFAIQMTSAVSPTLGTTRTEETDVSESQKEFIDLAFRMAVLRAYSVAAATPSSAMIVIETPEASLDSVFVGNAGRMLRSWCEPLGAERNSIIASSNLNRENMISALLGLRKQDAPHPSPDEIDRRVVNLLELAAENAALASFRSTYENELRTALTPQTDDVTG